MIEVFCISLKERKVTRLYSRTEGAYYPGYSSISLEGDFLSIQCNGSKYVQSFSLLAIVDFVKDQSMFAKVSYADINLSPYVSGYQIQPRFAHLFFIPKVWRNKDYSGASLPLMAYLQLFNHTTFESFGRQESFNRRRNG